MSDIFSAIGSLAGGIMQNNQANANIALQKKFAQNGIQWKVADAKKAGIHPLYALGAQTHSFAPVQSFAGDSIASMGQSIGRAVDSYSDKSQRADAFTKASQALQLENNKLNNDLLKQQIASNTATLNQPGTPPAAPGPANRYLIPGQGSTGGRPLIDAQPTKVTIPDPSRPHNEAGASPEVGWNKTATGWAPGRSEKFAQSAEDDWAAGVGWNIRNRLVPMMSIKETRPPFSPGKGRMWEWNWLLQEYQSVPIPNKPFIMKLERR
nr:MAG: DNA pilot protein [Microvirus sp.]